MPRIDALPTDAIDDPEIVAALDRLEQAGAPGAWLVRFAARVPEHGKALLRMLEVVNEGGDLPPRLRHLVRLLLAQMAGDEYTAAISIYALTAEGLDPDWLGELRWIYADSPLIDERERLALRFAEQMFLDAKGVNDAMYDEMRTVFTEPEIMRIATITGVNYAICLLVSTTKATTAGDAG